MKLIRSLLRTVFLGPSIPRARLRGRSELQFVTLANGGVPIH